MRSSILKPFIIFFTIIFALILSSCGKDEPGKKSNLPHRTVLVYMVADNSLGREECDQADLDEMLIAAKAGDINGGRLIVYHNRPGTARGNVPQLLEVTKDGLVTLKEYPDAAIYSVDPERMKEVIADTKRIAPADDYGLVLWSHANGWLENMGANDEDDYRGGRAFGDDRGKHMKLTTLASALAGNYFSFIYFDCCLMGTVEVAYELRGLTPVIVASPTELPIDGMPYDLNVDAFFVKGNPDMLRAARNTYDLYSAPNSTTPYCQMVVINTEGLTDLASAARSIFANVTTYPTSVSSIQKYSTGSKSYDFKQYMTMIAGNDKNKLTALENAFSSTVALALTTPTGMDLASIHNFISIDTYNGLGSYIILKASDVTYRGYNNCSWYRDVVSASPLYKR